MVRLLCVLKYIMKQTARLENYVERNYTTYLKVVFSMFVWNLYNKMGKGRYDLHRWTS